MRIQTEAGLKQGDIPAFSLFRPLNVSFHRQRASYAGFLRSIFIINQKYMNIISHYRGIASGEKPYIVLV